MVLPGVVVPVAEMDGTIPKASRSGWVTKERGQRFPAYGPRVAEVAHNTISFRCFYQPGPISFAIAPVLAELGRARFCLKPHGVGIRSPEAEL